MKILSKKARHASCQRSAGPGSAEKPARHDRPQTCLQSLLEKRRGGILNFSDTRMNKVIILLTDTAKIRQAKPRKRSDQNASRVSGLGRPALQTAAAPPGTSPAPTYLLCLLSLADAWQVSRLRRFELSSRSRELIGSLDCSISYSKVTFSKAMSSSGFFTNFPIWDGIIPKFSDSKYGARTQSEVDFPCSGLLMVVDVSPDTVWHLWLVTTADERRGGCRIPWVSLLRPPQAPRGGRVSQTAEH